MSVLKLISKQERKPVIVYECKLSKTINQYPDFTIVGDGVFIQGELKFKEQQSQIIKEINGMQWFTGKEFWYVLDDSLNIEYIKQQVRNKMVKILPLSLFHNELKRVIT
jgi:hypothetical protein